jgi:hypothetical protein
LTIVVRCDTIRVEVMEMAKEALTKKYRFWEKSLDILEWAHGQRVELHYLYPERKLIRASERARKTRSRLWSVADEEIRYFRLFPRPISAARATQAFFETAYYEEADVETYPALVVPFTFEVDAWDTKGIKEEAQEKMEQDWYEHWPFEERRYLIIPKASFLVATWFIRDQG